MNVKESTIRYWVHVKYIPHIKFQSLVRFRKTDIDAWLDQTDGPGTDDDREEDQRGEPGRDPESASQGEGSRCQAIIHILDRPAFLRHRHLSKGDPADPEAQTGSAPLPAALGLYRTDTALAKHARWPVGAVRRWIAGGYIRPLLHRGKLYYSIRSVREFVARVLRDWPKHRGFLERSVGARLEYDPRTKIIRKVGPLPS